MSQNESKYALFVVTFWFFSVVLFSALIYNAFSWTALCSTSTFFSLWAVLSFLLLSMSFSNVALQRRRLKKRFMVICETS